MRVLPAEMPGFFRSGAMSVAHMSVDPDVVKNKAVPAARESEYPEHYLDLEMLGGRQLPRTRFEFVKLCCDLGLGPEKVGMLPYAICEWTERLAVAFAEHRKWPDNAAVRSKCLVYAGPLAHYCGDLCQPLHLTVDYDGRAKPDGTSPRSGIHEKVDGLIENLGARPEAIAQSLSPVAVDTVWPFVMAEIARSHALIDTLYAMEQRLPPVKGTKPSADVAAFAMERARRAAAVIAGLYLYAWHLSARIEMEDWLDRKAMDGPVK